MCLKYSSPRILLLCLRYSSPSPQAYIFWASGIPPLLGLFLSFSSDVSLLEPGNPCPSPQVFLSCASGIPLDCASGIHLMGLKYSSPWPQIFISWLKGNIFPWPQVFVFFASGIPSHLLAIRYCIPLLGLRYSSHLLAIRYCIPLLGLRYNSTEPQEYLS